MSHSSFIDQLYNTDNINISQTWHQISKYPIDTKKGAVPSSDSCKVSGQIWASGLKGNARKPALCKLGECWSTHFSHVGTKDEEETNQNATLLKYDIPHRIWNPWMYAHHLIPKCHLSPDWSACDALLSHTVAVMSTTLHGQLFSICTYSLLSYSFIRFSLHSPLICNAYAITSYQNVMCRQTELHIMQCRLSHIVAVIATPLHGQLSNICTASCHIVFYFSSVQCSDTTQNILYIIPSKQSHGITCHVLSSLPCALCNTKHNILTICALHPI